MVESLTRTSRLAQNDRLLVSYFFQDFQRGTIMYCNHLARIDSSIKPRHLIQMIVPSEASWLLWKFAYLCLLRLKCSYVIPGKKAFSLSVKTHTRCLHILFYVRISHRGPSRNSHFVLSLLYIGFCHSRGTVSQVLIMSFFLVHPMWWIYSTGIYQTLRQINSFERCTQAVRNTTYNIK